MQYSLLLLVSLIVTIAALDNGLGLVPQMAWNSWNAIGCNINEQLIKNQAQALVKTGLADAGYQYINMDDCWQRSRNGSGFIQADPADFPSGIAALADFVHSLGLKFGLYSDAGNQTCAGRPGSLGYETQDATQYAAWRVDYLKYDNCNNEGIPDPLRYIPMRDALNKTGRPMFFSMCDWVVTTSVWGPNTGNSWRTTQDIGHDWQMWTSNLDQNNAIAAAAGPGGWNDPDMLEVGNGLSDDENVAHFSLWSLVKAPLVLGNDLTKITPAILTLLTNKEVIAVNQDPLGKQGVRVAHTRSVDSKVVGNNLYADDCVQGLTSQLWSYNPSSKTIESKLVAGQCVGEYARDWNCGKSAIGNALYIQPCGQLCNGANQKWTFSNGTLQTAYGTALCLEITAGTASEVLLGWTCTGAANQKWSLEADGTIRNNGKCLTVSGGQEVWAGPLHDGSIAVVLFNRAASAQKVTVQWADIGLKGTANVRDLWAHKDLGAFETSFSVVVNSHGAAMLKISK